MVYTTREKGKFYCVMSVIIRNRVSGETRNLTKNKVANSLPDGTLKVREITPRELEMLKKRESDVGESEGDEDNNQEGSSSSDNEDEIIIEFQDASGNQKTIIIKVN